MARTSVYADVCDGCFELRWPYAGEVTGRQHGGRYFCPTCNRQWWCGYTTDLALLAMIP